MPIRICTIDSTIQSRCVINIIHIYCHQIVLQYSDKWVIIIFVLRDIKNLISVFKTDISIPFNYNTTFKYLAQVPVLFYISHPIDNST